MHGGATQAVGQAILEEAIINEEGQLAVTYADYLIPTAVRLLSLRVTSRKNLMHLNIRAVLRELGKQH